MSNDDFMTPSQMKIRRCSFCGKPHDQVRRFVAGPDVGICNECILLCQEIIAQDLPAAPEVGGGLPTPAEMKRILDDYVVGQEQAKRALCVAVYNHYKRLVAAQSKNEEVELDKSNIILVGPTGTGKTLIARTIARLLGVPFTIVDATVLTQAGYVGEDVESILSRLYQASGYDVEATERGIIFIDALLTNSSVMRITAYSLGCSTVAMFNRVAGGNYTKAADISADILGKIRNDLPEDDSRVPNVIADFIGDNVNDIAGNCSDLLESFVATISASIVLAIAFLGNSGVALNL